MTKLNPAIAVWLRASRTEGYNPESVDAEIAKDKTISKTEARLIHALLKGRG